MPKAISSLSVRSARGETRSKTPVVSKTSAASSPRKNAAAGSATKAAAATAEPKRVSGIRRRGFASMSPERRREIASRGGKASHGGGRPANQGKNGNAGARGTNQDNGSRGALGRTSQEQYRDPRSEYSSRGPWNGDGRGGRGEEGYGRREEEIYHRGPGASDQRPTTSRSGFGTSPEATRGASARGRFNDSRRHPDDRQREQGRDSDYSRDGRDGDGGQRYADDGYRREPYWDSRNGQDSPQRDYSPGQYRGPGFEDRGWSRRDEGQQQQRSWESQGYGRAEQGGGRDDGRREGQEFSRQGGPYYDQDPRGNGQPRQEWRESDPRNGQSGRWEGSGDQGARENYGEVRYEPQSGRRGYRGGDNDYTARAESQNGNARGKDNGDQRVARGRGQNSSRKNGR